MYERLNRSTQNALAYHISDKLSRDEVRQLTDELEGAISACGKIRILLELHGSPYGGIGAVWEDVKFEMKFGSDIERMALVGDKDVQKWNHRLFGELIGTQIHYFDPDQLDEAWAWLAEEP
jgi:hypothetical protein